MGSFQLSPSTPSWSRGSRSFDALQSIHVLYYYRRELASFNPSPPASSRPSPTAPLIPLTLTDLHLGFASSPNISPVLCPFEQAFGAGVPKKLPNLMTAFIQLWTTSE